MRLSVSDENLRLVLSRFRPHPDANVEIVVSPEGLDILANREGYLTLARWFMVMAHPEMEDHSEREWFHAAYHLDHVLEDDQARLVYSSRGKRRPLETHDVRMYRSETSGDSWWGPIVPREVWEEAVRRHEQDDGGDASGGR